MFSDLDFYSEMKFQNDRYSFEVAKGQETRETFLAIYFNKYHTNIKSTLFSLE